MVLVFFLILFAILRRVSFILKTDQFLHTVPLTDFLPGSTCSAELGAAVVQVRWKSQQSGAERRFRDASENTSIAYNSRDQLWRSRWSCRALHYQDTNQNMATWHENIAKLRRTSSKKLDFLTFSLLVYGLSFDERLKAAHFHTDFKTYVDILAVDPHAW